MEDCRNTMTGAILERLAIREVIDNWAIWSDSGNWDRFRTVWHDDGRISTTWFQGTGEEFVEARREGWERGVSILHSLGGSSIDLAGDRAIAQTKMTISQRGNVHGVVCDVLCTGRFYDFFEKRDQRWAIVFRQPIYEKDRIDPVEPGVTLQLDPTLLNRFPEGYRHLAYLQLVTGFQIEGEARPGLKGPAVEALYKRGAKWLAGESLNS